MNVARLKYFIAVTVSGSFSEAAEMLFTTQSAVSKQIIALEKEINVQLFDRSRRKIVLTAQGHVVLKYAQKIMDGYNEMIEVLSDFEQYQGGSLFIASIPVMAQYDITSLVANFRRSYPNINMVVDEREGQDILPALEQRQYELAFMRGEVLNSNIYEHIDLYKDKLVAVLPETHPLAHLPSIQLRQLKENRFLLLNKGTLLYDYCISACEKSGFTPVVSYTGTRMENIVELVAKDMGISLMMEKAVSYIKAQGICLVPLLENITSTISLVRTRKKKLTKAGLVFWQFVNQTLEQ